MRSAVIRPQLVLSSIGTPRLSAWATISGRSGCSIGSPIWCSLTGKSGPRQRPLLGDLVEDAEHPLLLHEAAPAAHDLVGAPGALEVAGVRDLDEEVVDRVEAARHLAQLGQRRRGGEGGARSSGGGEARGDARDEQLAAELQPEGGAEVLGARRVEVGQREEGAAEAAQAGRVGLPALLGRLVEPVPRRPSGRARRTAGGTRRTAGRSTRPRPTGRRRRGGGRPRAA